MNFEKDHRSMVFFVAHKQMVRYANHMFQFLRKKKKMVYMDFASKTPLRDDIRKHIDSLEKSLIGNAGAIHSLGVEAKRYLTKAREDVANILGTHTDEIIFTRGGTESDNMAILGAVFGFRNNSKDKSKIPHIIIGALEHPAIVESAKYIEKNNYATVSILPVNQDGIVDIEVLSKLLTPQTILVSVQYVNGEIGSIQPMNEIVQIVRRYKKKIHGDRFSSYPLVHTDTAQAVGAGLPLNIALLGVDLLSINGSKIYGPTSTGLLYKKRGTPIEPVLFGGDQENGFRPGTAPVSLIVGFAEALVSMLTDTVEVVRLHEIREYFISQFLKLIRALSLSDRVAISGGATNTKVAPHIVHIVVRGIESDHLVLSLDSY